MVNDDSRHVAAHGHNNDSIRRSRAPTAFGGAPRASSFRRRAGRELSMKQARLARCSIVALLSCLGVARAPAGEFARGALVFSSARHCIASGRAPQDICRHAEANAAAEFAEKAPRFARRELCERAFGAGGCALGLRGAEGWAGRPGGVYFSPRPRGFRILLRSEHDARVTPLGADLRFDWRSASRRDATIARRAPGDGQRLAVERNDAAIVSPAPLSVDPNFDCARYLEPTAMGDPSTACAPMPARR